MMLRGFGSGAVALGAVFAIGCSDTAAPPARGGLYLEIASAVSPPAGKTCQIPTHTATIGTIAPSASSKGKPIVDGENGTVECTVNGKSTINFRGRLSKAAASFFIQGSVERGGTGTATILEADNASTIQLSSPDDTPCNVDVSKEPMGASEDKIWAQITCPALISESQPSVYCASPLGWFVFDDCD